MPILILLGIARGLVILGAKYVFTGGGNILKRLMLVCWLCLLSFHVMGCDKVQSIFGGDVALVQGGMMEFDKSLTVGQAMANYKYFSKSGWSAEKSENGKRIVNVVAEIDTGKHPQFNTQEIPDLKKFEMKFQFVINQDETFQLGWCGVVVEKTNGEKHETGKEVTLENCMTSLREIYANSPTL